MNGVEWKKGFIEVSRPGNGNCCFTTMLDSLGCNISLAHQLRQLLCDKMQKLVNQELGGKLGIDEQYVVRMREDKVWGGEVEWLTLTEILKCRAVIYMYDVQKL